MDFMQNLGVAIFADRYYLGLQKRWGTAYRYLSREYTRDYDCNLSFVWIYLGKRPFRIFENTVCKP